MRAEDIPNDGRHVALDQPLLTLIGPLDASGDSVQVVLANHPLGGVALFATILNADTDVMLEEDGPDVYAQAVMVARFGEDMSGAAAAQLIRSIAMSEPVGGSLYDSVAGDADDE